jgi:hypothetical protein
MGTPSRIFRFGTRQSDHYWDSRALSQAEIDKLFTLDGLKTLLGLNRYDSFYGLSWRG